MKIETTIEQLEAILPHGSGINSDWNIKDKGQYFKCENSFHCMDDFGYYVGYSDFSIIIDKKLELINSGFPKERQFWSINSRLHFHGQSSKNLNNKYMLRDYLEDIFTYCLNENFTSRL